MLESLKKTMCSVTAAAVITTTLGMSAVFANDTASGADYTYSIKEAYFSSSGNTLNVNVEYTGESAKPAKLIAASYNESGVVTNAKVVDVNGTENISFDYAKNNDENVKLYVWDSMDTISPLSSTTVPTQRTGNEKYTVSVAEGITGGTVKIVQPESKISEYLVTENTPTEEDSYLNNDIILMNDDNIKVTNLFRAKIMDNLEKDPGDPISVEIEGKNCCKYIPIGLSSAPSDYDSLSPSGKGTALDITAKKNGTFTIYHRWYTDGRSLKISVWNEDFSSAEELSVENTSVSGSILPDAAVNVQYGYGTFDVEAGKTYLLWSSGYTPEVFGYTFEPAEE